MSRHQHLHEMTTDESDDEAPRSPSSDASPMPVDDMSRSLSPSPTAPPLKQLSPPDPTSSTSPTPPSKPRTPLPKTQLALLGTCLYGVLFSQNVLFPFLPFMVSSFFPSLPTSQLGYRAGYLGAAFPAGLTLSSYMWGRVADRWGRKPCLMIGLVCTCVCITAFGFSGSFVEAVMWRFLAGALNGNNGIVKTMVSEVCDDTNMATGFSLIGLLGGLARLTSPAIGGFLAEPAKQYAALGGVAWLERWPYALPCVVGGVIAAVSLVLVSVFLKETLPAAAEQWSWPSIRTRLIALWRRCTGKSGYDRMETERAATVPQAETAPLPDVDSTTAPSASIASLLTMPTVSIAIYLNAIMAFLAIIQTEIIPLWVVLPPEYGGFSMQPTAIASLLMALGPFQMAHQVFIYPRLTARFGSKQLFRYALTGVGVFCALMPFTFYLRHVAPSGWLPWLGLVCCFIAMVLCRVTSFTCCFVLLNNACTPAIKASANGLAQSAASLAQIIGPVMGGLVFAWSVGVGKWPIDFGLVWQIQAVVCAVGVWLCGRLPDSVDRKAEPALQQELMRKQTTPQAAVVEAAAMGGEGQSKLELEDGDELHAVSLEVLEDDEILGWADDEEEDGGIAVDGVDGQTDDAIEMITCIRPNGSIAILRS